MGEAHRYYSPFSRCRQSQRSCVTRGEERPTRNKERPTSKCVAYIVEDYIIAIMQSITFLVGRSSLDVPCWKFHTPRQHFTQIPHQLPQLNKYRMRLLTTATIFVLFSNVLFTQDTLLSTILKADRGNLYVDMEDSTATVFMLYQNPYMSYPELYHTEYLKRQPNGEFTGKMARIIGGNTLHYRYPNPYKPERWRKTKLITAPNPYHTHRTIALSHFHAALSDLEREGVQSSQTLGYSTICDSILRPDRHYKEHLPLVMAPLMPIIAESAPILARKTKIIEYVKLHLRTLPSTEIRDSVRLLRSFSERSAEASRLLETIAVQRPDAFLQMMDEMPSYKSYFLDIATNRGKAVRAIKKAKGHTNLKKEILRKHRREMAYGIGAVTFYVAIDTLLVWGVIKFI